MRSITTVIRWVVIKNVVTTQIPACHEREKKETVQINVSCPLQETKKKQRIPSSGNFLP
jgi:hypothetical protein